MTDSAQKNVSYETKNLTISTYKPLQSAYDFFNRELFENKLPECLITVQRKRNARGYFCPERFISRLENSYSVHEIALNPKFFEDRTDEDIISTLVHEMVHLWQQEFGKPSRGGYHNREWADKMEDIGLIPSDTEEEGGSRTGQRMSHYIDKDGRFSILCSAFLETNKNPLIFQDRPVVARPKSKNKVKYICPECETKIWAKPGVNVICGDDHKKMLEVS